MAASQSIFFQTVDIFFFLSWSTTIIFCSLTLLVIVPHWRRQCRSVNNLLTCNSCVALLLNVLGLFLQSPHYNERIYTDGPSLSHSACQIYGFLTFFASAVLAFSYNIQVLSRFFITVLYKHRFLTTFYLNWILIVVSWCISGIVTGCLAISPEAYQYEPMSHVCVLSTRNFTTSFTYSAVVIVSTCSTMSILYGIILCKTVRHTGINSNHVTALRVKRNMKVFKRLFMFIGIFGFGALPYFLCVILNCFDATPWPLYTIAYLCVSVAAAANSVAILLTNDQVKEILLKKLTVCQKRRPEIPAIRRQNCPMLDGTKLAVVRPLPTVG